MREKILFNENWYFHRGDIRLPLPKTKDPIYLSAKTERELWGPAAVCYNDSTMDYRKTHELQTEKWEKVTLPHDYVISGKFDENENNTLGYLKYENAWYRKHFTLVPEDKGKRITLLFEAIATESTVYLNGVHLKHNFSGYNSFEVDITDFVRFDKENILAVYVNTEHHESWWYEGGGIYRNVWLIKTAPVCIDLWGVFVSPQRLEENLWQINVETTIRNTSYTAQTVEAVSVITDKNGVEVGRCSGSVTIPERSSGKAEASVMLENPCLWDPDDPYTYTCRTSLYPRQTKAASFGDEDSLFSVFGKLWNDAAEAVDPNLSLPTENKEEEPPLDESIDIFGCRTFVCDPEEGLFINGKHTKIKGVCGHYDFGLTGKAVPDNIFRHKVRMLKEMGANGYRTSHYPQAEALMDALRDNGFIVLDETRWFSTSDEAMSALEMLVKRDRNNPAVFFWSIGNEEPIFTDERGSRIASAMMTRVKQLDPTRPVTAACDRPDLACIYRDLDVIGINYGLDSYDNVRKSYPSKPVMSTECCATGSTRGWYYDSFNKKQYINAFDRDTNDWFRGRERTWKFIMERKWVMGAYQWIGFEHRGETTWPRLASQSGAIDLFLQKKDAFYQNQSLWSDKPMIHLLPHWNHPSRLGETLDIWAYTNCAEAELFVNGISMGRTAVEKFGHAAWKAEYIPGKIEVIGYIHGEAVCHDQYETTGCAAKLKLKPENGGDVSANGMDIALFTCYAEDSEGREVPDASPFVSFISNSLGSIIGTGSDITDHTPVASTERKMRAGRISIAIKVGKDHGTLRLYAEAIGLEPASITLEL